MEAYIKPLIAQSIKKGTPKRPFELSKKQLETLRNVSDIVMAVGTVAGTLALTALAPNIFQCLDKMPWVRKTYKNRDTKWSDQQKKITQSIYYLKRQGYVKLVRSGSDLKLVISKKGRKKIRMMQFESLQVSTPQKWDGHWWVIIADIPKEYRRYADYFRAKLKSMNFYHLQRTVWVFPYDPRDEVDLVGGYYGVERFVTTMEVTKLDPEDEATVKKFFRQNKILS